ncbi:MAG: class I SAM-dependent methyltransferase [Planctomycetota bacterium]|jgi:hypothetical protein
MTAGAVAVELPASGGVPENQVALYGRIDYLGRRFHRLHSYRYQLIYALRSQPKTALLIGKGDGLVTDLLRRARVDVTTLDIDPALEPDAVGSVEDIPLPGNAFDVAICCEVLEHLPFERFRACLGQLGRVTRRHLVVSVPDIRRFVRFRLQAPRVDLDWQLSLPRFGAKVTPERFAACPHFWEIGFAGTGSRAVRRAIRDSGWRIDESRRVSELPWHHFFYCTKPRP